MMRLSFSLVIAACIAQSSFAQSADTAKFNRLYHSAIENVASLYATKGVNFYCDKERKYNYAEDVISLTATYRGKADSIGMLFYFFDKDSLSVWLYKNKTFTQSAVKLTHDSLFELEKQLIAALRIESRKISGARSLRGTEVIDFDSSKVIPLPAAIAKATRILLPGRIARALTGIQHLMIIPQLNIGKIPFAILQPFPSGAYLIDSFSLSFAPHLCNLNVTNKTALHSSGEKLSYHPWNPLVVGNPTFSSRELLPLPGAEDEAKEVASLLQTKALTGKNATLSSITWRSRDADLLYFATHGYFDMEKMLTGSYLAFTPDSTNPSGKWMASDIHKAELHADLAILSACQTGIGKSYDAGFIGIGRTFFMAGVRNTVTSLWSVDDKATVGLMTEFVKQLKEPDYFYPSQHLRKAMLAYRKHNPDITQWAPFMVFGYTY